jgi:ABC-2 type transport system ATP-binding protein
MKEAIKTVDLTRVYVEKKRFGRGIKRRVVALDSVNLEVREGELFGLLGPNGAGKTTLIKILTTLLYPTSGKAFVDGFDVVKNPLQVRMRINLVAGGEETGYGILTVRETLWMFSQFYGLPNRVAKERIEWLLKEVGLEKEANRKISTLSTGMRQRMNFARGFLSDPKVIFLDEPTLGLDVESSRHLRRFIYHWIRERPHKTVLLTTHNMQEAEELCDRIAIIHNGKILACETPQNLKAMLKGGPRFKLIVDSKDGKSPKLENDAIRKWNWTPRPDLGIGELFIHLKSEEAIPWILEKLVKSGHKVRSLEKLEPSLEEVFVSIVGKTIEEADER